VPDSVGGLNVYYPEMSLMYVPKSKIFFSVGINNDSRGCNGSKSETQSNCSLALKTPSIYTFRNRNIDLETILLFNEGLLRAP